MQAKIKRQEFNSITDADLSTKCFEPLIKHYKKRMAEQTDSTQMKEQFYEELTDGQRALFMFYAYYIHVSKSSIEFFWWSAYFIAQPKSWSAIKAALKFFEDTNMLILLEKIELILKQHQYPETLESFTITREDLANNKELYTTIQSLYSVFEDTSPLTIKNINNIIEKNLKDFVEIED
ncbi:hypothetical protein ACTHO0_01935 [Cytobacillus praedii]|uniref:hypothetical protein n=1 Tax=Cytobacillus praedii TaxID=1742358 RepID=UPI003F7F874E